MIIEIIMFPSVGPKNKHMSSHILFNTDLWVDLALATWAVALRRGFWGRAEPGLGLSGSWIHYLMTNPCSLASFQGLDKHTRNFTHSSCFLSPDGGGFAQKMFLSKWSCRLTINSSQTFRSRHLSMQHLSKTWKVLHRGHPRMAGGSPASLVGLAGPTAPLVKCLIPMRSPSASYPRNVLTNACS